MPKITVFSAHGVEVQDDRTLEAARDECVARIKAEAERRILDLAPLHRQLNAQARATELVLLRLGGEAWTTSEAEEAATLQAMRDAIQAIRTASNEAESLVLAARTNDAADSVVPAWPAIARI